MKAKAKAKHPSDGLCDFDGCYEKAIMSVCGYGVGHSACAAHKEWAIDDVESYRMAGGKEPKP